MSHQSIGDRLRRAREAIPASLHQAARETKIRLDYLESMERGSFHFLKGKVYTRGMLQGYARWLGLDADEAGREFDSLQAGPANPPLAETFRRPHWQLARPRPQWAFGAGAAVTILLVLSLVGLIRPKSPVAKPPPLPAATSSVAQAPDQSSPAVLAQAPSPKADGVHLVVTVTGDKCWTLVVADSGKAFEGILTSGTSKAFDAKDLLKVTFGNLGAIRIQLNGKDLGTPGGPGQTGTFQFGPNTTTLQG